MDEFKKVVAGNITRLRTSMNLTQAQLGVSQAIYEFVVAKVQLEEVLGYDFTEY